MFLVRAERMTNFLEKGTRSENNNLLSQDYLLLECVDSMPSRPGVSGTAIQFNL